MSDMLHLAMYCKYGHVLKETVPPDIAKIMELCGITFTDLILFTKEDFVSIGVKLGHRVKLQHFKHQLHCYTFFWQQDCYYNLLGYHSIQSF